MRRKELFVEPDQTFEDMAREPIMRVNRGEGQRWSVIVPNGSAVRLLGVYNAEAGGSVGAPAVSMQIGRLALAVSRDQAIALRDALDRGVPALDALVEEGE